KDAIRRRGENVSSYDVEAAINGHPAVLESAVVGVASDAGEQEVLAAIVLKAGAQLDGAELVRYLVDKLPYFMVPRYVRFVSALPKTPTLRVMKHEIRVMGVEGAWDLSTAGLRMTRTGLQKMSKGSGADSRSSG